MNYIAPVKSNLSNGYIYLYRTGPPTFTLNDKCTGRCSIESKNDGGNIISSLHIVSTIFFSSLFNVINIQLAGAYISEEMTNLR